MIIQEIITNDLDINSDIIIEYFKTLEYGEIPTIDGLMQYVNDNYYCSDLEINSDGEYQGDNAELIELFNEYND